MKKRILATYCAIVPAAFAAKMDVSTALLVLAAIGVPALLGYLIGRDSAWDRPGGWDDH